MVCAHCGATHAPEAAVCPRTDRPLSAPGPCGQVIDRYHVEALLGSGGFGSVYRGRHVHTNRAVAIKFLRGDLAADSTMLARFKREAQTMAAIDSPHVVQVLDWGALPDGDAYLVMELLAGHDLKTELVHKGPFAVDRVTIETIANESPPHSICHDNYDPAAAFPAASFPIDIAIGAQQQFHIGTPGIGSVDQGNCMFLITFMAGGLIQTQTFTAGFLTATGGVPIDMQPTAVDFGDQSTTGGFEDQYIFLNNTDQPVHTATLDIASTFGDSTAYTFQSDNCIDSNTCAIQSIPPNTFHAVKVRCHTSAVGTSTAMIVADSFGEIPLHCNGVAGTNGPRIRVPTKIDAGTVPVGGTATIDVEIDDIGNQALSGLRVAFDGAAASSDWSADDCVTTDCSVPSSDSKVFHVTLAPSAAGDRSATMTITSNANNGPQQIMLVGTTPGGSGGDAGMGGDDEPGHRPPSSFYACSSGQPTHAWPLVVALAAIRRRKRG